jgi:hypothetical protein
MPEPQERQDSVESMAFQLLLQKVTGLERAMASIPPLLKKIIDQLETQAKQPDVEVATYAQLYPETLEDEPETVQAADPLPERRRRVWRWFVKEEAR